ncbi:MAG: hypothetical protein WCF03_20585 [Nitrososphaeraceae archaeon]
MSRTDQLSRIICVSITMIPIIHIGKAVYGWPQKMNGFELCREINKIAVIRVCLLTAGELYYGCIAFIYSI